jgi:hypothetical protein
MQREGMKELLLKGEIDAIPDPAKVQTVNGDRRAP